MPKGLFVRRIRVPEANRPCRREALRAAPREFVDHYHEERAHQSLDNELIAPRAQVTGTGPLKCRERLGGVLKFYLPRGRPALGRAFAHDAVAAAKIESRQ